MFSYAQAAADLAEHGWTEAKLKLFVHTKWKVEWASIKPTLTPKHMQDRVEHAAECAGDACLAEVQEDEKNWSTTGNKLTIKHPVDRPDAKYIHRPNKKQSPKIMVLMMTARPNPRYGFDGKIACIRVSFTKKALRKSKHHEKGDEYEMDCTMTAEKFYEIMKDEGFPAIESKMWWMKGKVVLYRYDRATPHVGHDMIARLNELGKRFNPRIKVEPQPAKSPNTNVHDIALFPSMSARTGPRQKYLRFFDRDGLWGAVQEI